MSNFFQDAIDEYRRREGEKGLVSYPKPLPMPDFDILPHKMLGGPVGTPLDPDAPLSIFRTLWFLHPCMTEGEHSIQMIKCGVLMGCALFSRRSDTNRPIWAIEHVRATINSVSTLYDAPAAVMPRYRRILLAWDGREMRIGLDMMRVTYMHLNLRVNRPCLVWVGSFMWDAPHR